MSLGWVNKEMLDGGKAVTFYEFAADLDKSNALPIYRVGMIYFQSRNMPKFEESMKKAIAIDPNFSMASRTLGDYYYRANKMSSANAMYQNFINGSRGELDEVTYRRPDAVC